MQHNREQMLRERDQEASFQHTQLGVYLTGAFGLMYLWSSSAQVRCDVYSTETLLSTFPGGLAVLQLSGLLATKRPMLLLCMSHRGLLTSITSASAGSTSTVSI